MRMKKILAFLSLGILIGLATPVSAVSDCGSKVEIKAEKMRFELDIETDNILEYLKSLLEVVGDLLQGKIVAKNVVMENAEIKRVVIIEASKIEIPRVEMKISLLSILGETITNLDQLMKMITGREVEWENVRICASEMNTGRMTFSGLSVWRCEEC